MNERREDGINAGGEGGPDSLDIEMLYTNIASDYVRHEGEKLRAENEYYINNAPFPSSIGFEDRVYKKTRAIKYRRYTYVMSAIAASIMVVLVGFNAFSAFFRSQTMTPGFQTADSFPHDNNQTAEAGRTDNLPRGDNGATDAEPAINPPSGGGQASATERADNIPRGDNQANDAEPSIYPPSGGDQASATEHADNLPLDNNQDADAGRADIFPYASDATFEIIALSFELPAGHTVSDIKQDIGQTVYHIENEKNDDIVLTIEKSIEAGGTGLFNEARLINVGLVEIEINDTKLYAIAKPDFSRFTFQKEGIIYDMTCKYDYNTLVSLCEYVL